MNTYLSNSNLNELFDEDGFFKQPETWDHDIACSIANDSGISTLTETHWLVLESLREQYQHYGTPPMFHHVCHINHLGKHEMEALFHSNREAWRIAGLPNPGEEAKAYM